MRIGAIQSSFIPWRGYFDFIKSVDKFIFLDDLQYTVRDWRNRNKLKTPKGAEWVTVPVFHDHQKQRINETRILNEGNWQKKIIGAWMSNYRSALYYETGLALLRHIEGRSYSTISQLNIDLIKRICEYLDIATPMILSSELNLQGSKTERLIEMMKKLNATNYLSGPNADAYLDKEAFRRNNICLEYKTYDYMPYPQLWGDFIGEVTVLDLIANCGPSAKYQIKSHSPDRVICP
jgi:hypothetical protein